MTAAADPTASAADSTGSTNPPPSADPLYHLPAARGDEQLARMRRLEAERVCVFCDEHVAAVHGETILLRGAHWYVVANGFPYAGTRAHYLIVANRHVRSFEELPDEAGAELWALKRALAAELAPLATATVERSGDMRYNGGSVAHLHVHFVALNADPEQTVRFKVSRDPDDPR
jgi:diadenosine tetraphosphate (Ap4A) HIT family hydrolase